MATFEAQVSGLTSLTIDDSSSPTRAELNQFLTDGAKEIINQLPPDLLGLCSAQQTFTSVAPGSEDETMNTGKVLSVFRNDGDIDQPCRKISPTKKGRVLDSDDMSYASITDPIYYTENNKINSLPSGGSCKYSEVQYPTVSYTHDAIAIFPDEAEYLVALYGAIRSIQNKMGSKTSDLPSDMVLPAMPTPPALPSYTTPTVGAITIASLPSAPDYTAPKVAGATEELTAAITDGTVGTDADWQDYSDWFEVLGQMIEDNEDVELAQSQLQKISTYIQSYSQAMQNQLNIFNEGNVVYQAAIQRNIQQAQINAQDAQQEANLLLQKESQEYQAKLTKYSNEIQSYQADVNRIVQDFDSKIKKHSADYQWLTGQYQQLLAEYQRGLTALRG